MLLSNLLFVLFAKKPSAQFLSPESLPKKYKRQSSFNGDDPKYYEKLILGGFEDSESSALSTYLNSVRTTLDIPKAQSDAAYVNQAVAGGLQKGKKLENNCNP